ncbi:MAG: hypothetical protein IKP73_02595 [Bacteroidales bacterium]|nr:hypothetical protein [Bacteroidales bacterium]
MAKKYIKAQNFEQSSTPQSDKNNGKDKGGCSVVLLLITLVFCAGVFMFGWWLKGLANDYEMTEEDAQQERMFSLPELTTDEAITAAVNSGDPRDYLIKDYVFQKAQLVRDTVLDLLNGSYICIDIVEESRTSRAEQKLNSNLDTLILRISEQPYCQIVGDLYLNDGTPLQKPDSLQFLFSYWKKMYRIWESEINPRKKDFFIQSRYYPNRDYSFCFNVTYMAQDEKATFAARLGNGRASLDVFPGKDLVLVGGSRISVGDNNSLASMVWTIMGYLFMGGGVIIAIAALRGKNMFDQKFSE